MTSYLLLCFVAVASLHFGDCTKCYTCTSATDPKCADPMTPDESKAMECNSQALKQVTDLYNSASKKIANWADSLGMSFNNQQVNANFICSKIDVSEGDKKTTVRGCSLPQSDKFDPCKTIMEKYSGDNIAVTFCGTCTTDFCNSATSLRITAAFLLPLLAVLLSNY